MKGPQVNKARRSVAILIAFVLMSGAAIFVSSPPAAACNSNTGYYGCSYGSPSPYARAAVSGGTYASYTYYW